MRGNMNIRSHIRGQILRRKSDRAMSHTSSNELLSIFGTRKGAHKRVISSKYGSRKR